MEKILVLIRLQQNAKDIMQYPVYMIQYIISHQYIQKYKVFRTINFEYKVKSVDFTKLVMTQPIGQYTRCILYLGDFALNSNQEYHLLQIMEFIHTNNHKIKIYLIAHQYTRLFKFIDCKNSILMYLQQRMQDQYEQINQQIWGWQENKSHSTLTVIKQQDQIYCKFKTQLITINFRVKNGIIEQSHIKGINNSQQLYVSTKQKHLFCSTLEFDFEGQLIKQKFFANKFPKQFVFHIDEMPVRQQGIFNLRYKLEEGKIYQNEEVFYQVKFLDTERNFYQCIQQEQNKNSQGAVENGVFYGFMYYSNTNNQSSFIQQHLNYDTELKNTLKHSHDQKILIVNKNSIQFKYQKTVLITVIGNIAGYDYLERFVEIMTSFYYQLNTINYKIHKKIIMSMEELKFDYSHQQYDYYQLILGKGIQYRSESIIQFINNWKYQRVINHQQHNLMIISLQRMMPKELKAIFKSLLLKLKIIYIEKSAEDHVWGVSASLTTKQNHHFLASAQLSQSQVDRNCFQMRRYNVGIQILLGKNNQVYWCWQ